MKATFDIPDDLYRRVKARSAMEGRPVRAVAVELFNNWVSDQKAEPVSSHLETTSLSEPTRFDNAPWLEIARPYIKPGMSHDLDEIDEAIARGWGAEIAHKFKPTED
jgi:hypothetical protein